MKKDALGCAFGLLALAFLPWANTVSAEDLYRPAHEVAKHMGGNILDAATRCSSIPRAIWDGIHGGSCWKCPDDAPRRTIFKVDGPTACVGTKPVPSADCFTAHVAVDSAKCESNTVDFYVSAYNEDDGVLTIALVDTREKLNCPDKGYRQVKLCDAKVIAPGKKYKVKLNAITSPTCTFDYCSSESFTSSPIHPAADWTCEVKQLWGGPKPMKCRAGKP